MTFFEMPGERVIVLLAAGNLAVSQSVTGLLRERVTQARKQPAHGAHHGRRRAARG